MKRIRILLVCVYVYTASLPVHVLAMHAGGDHHQEIHEHDCTGDHDDHSHEGDHDAHGDMEVCINQSLGVLVDPVRVEEKVLSVGWQTPESGCTLEALHHGYYRIVYDPGRYIYSSFDAFIAARYGETVLHC